MPIIEFSEQDIKRGTLVTPAWYLMRIETIGEAHQRIRRTLQLTILLRV